MRVPFFLIANGCMEQVIAQIEFILGNAGEFILGHEISFDFDVPAKFVVCSAATVIGSDDRTGENGLFKSIHSDKICGCCCKPEKEEKYKYQKYFFDKFDGIHGFLLYSGSCSRVKVMEKWQASCTLEGYRWSEVP